jgi:hypothetical protein
MFRASSKTDRGSRMLEAQEWPWREMALLYRALLPISNHHNKVRWCSSSPVSFEIFFLGNQLSAVLHEDLRRKELDLL